MRVLAHALPVDSEPFRLPLLGAIGVPPNDADTVRATLLVAGDRPVVVELHSPGGDVFDGLAIANLLRAHAPGVTVVVIGLAASIASAIAAAARECVCYPSATFMLHNAWTPGTGGEAEDLRHAADTLEALTEQIAAIYAGKTGGPLSGIARMMAEETWLSADEALELGLVNRIIEAPAPTARALQRFDTRAFKRAPLVRLEACYAMLNGPAPTQNTPAASAAPAAPAAAQPQNAILEAERTRVATIMQDCRPYAVNAAVASLRDRAIAEAWTVEQTRGAILNTLGQGAAPVGGSLGDPHVEPGRDRMSEFQDAAVDALLIRGGVQVAKPHAAARDLVGMRICDVAETMLRGVGRSTAHMQPSDIIAAALTMRGGAPTFGPLAAITHTTSDFPSLLATTLGKALRMGYENSPTTLAWTGEIEVKDFKPQSLVQLSEASSLDLVGEGGEYHYGTFGDSAEKLQVNNYGKLFSITRHALINDDLNAFTRIPQAFGQSARRVEHDLVYAILTTNPVMSDSVSLFNSAHGNVASSGTALSTTSLALARAAMRRQKGLQGLAFVDPRPRFLVVPVTLETKAEILVATTIDPGASNNTEIPDFIKNLKVIADPRLDDASTIAWYLATSPNEMEGVVRGYLSGAQRFTYEEKDGWTVRGLEVRASLDVGAAAIDYRALFKNPGAS